MKSRTALTIIQILVCSALLGLLALLADHIIVVRQEINSEKQADLIQKELLQTYRDYYHSKELNNVLSSGD